MERKTIHLPTLREIGFSLLALLFATLSYFNFLDILNEWTRLGLDDLSFEQEYSPSQLSILKDIFIENLLIWGVVISIVLIIKLKIKAFPEEGLILGLITGLIGLLVAGLVAGLIFGLVEGLILGLVAGLILGLVWEFK